MVYSYVGLHFSATMNKKNIRTIVIVLSIGVWIFWGIKLYNNKSENNSLKKILNIYESGNIHESEIELIKFIENNPRSYKALTFLGQVYLELENDSLASINFNKALELNEENERALIGLGMVKNNSDDCTAAEMYYNAALKINPNSFEALRSLNTIKIKKGYYDAAIKECGLILEKSVDGENRIQILANLFFAYHLSNQIFPRDSVRTILELNNYLDVYLVDMMEDGTIDPENYFSCKE
jgi:tetratricopeptide (TPR) repeat protein